MDITKIFKKMTTTLPTSTTFENSAPGRRNNLAGSPSGNRYGIQTDREYYALLCYAGVVLDEKISVDVDYFLDFYFKQGCFCVSMWFKDEDASPYINNKNFVFVPATNYFCFFNPDAMQKAMMKDGSSVYYPKQMTECYCFQAVGQHGIPNYYRVLRDKAKQLPKPIDYDYTLAQYVGFVIKQKMNMENQLIEVREFIYGYALDIQ
jgi:hypothetical protein